MKNLMKIILVIVLAAAPLCSVGKNNSQKTQEQLKELHKIKNDLAQDARTLLKNADKAYEDCIRKKSAADCMKACFSIETLRNVIITIQGIEKVEKDIHKVFRIK